MFVIELVVLPLAFVDGCSDVVALPAVRLPPPSWVIPNVEHHRPHARPLVPTRLACPRPPLSASAVPVRVCVEAASPAKVKAKSKPSRGDCDFDFDCDYECDCN